MPTSKPSIEANSETYEVPTELVSLFVAIENTFRVGFTPTHEDGTMILLGLWKQKPQVQCCGVGQNALSS